MARRTLEPKLTLLNQHLRHPFMLRPGRITTQPDSSGFEGRGSKGRQSGEDSNCWPRISQCQDFCDTLFIKSLLSKGALSFVYLTLNPKPLPRRASAESAGDALDDLLGHRQADGCFRRNEGFIVNFVMRNARCRDSLPTSP